MRLVVLVLVLCFAAAGEWPIDSEPYGFLGCKQLRYRGVWECDKDTVHPDESIDGICISVSLANIMMYYAWPPFSSFDGIYLTTGYDGVIKHIDRRWDYSLITGPRTTYDCETDDPELRHSVENPQWSGLDEVHRLLYAVERSFGFDHNYFKIKDSTACNGDGYFGIEHVLRNRFGYPNARTIDAGKTSSRKTVIANLKQNIPVIAMRCDHIYLLDGYKYDKNRQRDLIHSSDYLQGEESIGWFPWKAFYIEKLDRFVVDIHPRVRIPAGPSTHTITYCWGEGYIPGTQYTERKGRLFVYRENNLPLGNIEILLQSVDLTPYTDDSVMTLSGMRGDFTARQITVPEAGYFDFGVLEAKKITVVIKNKDPFVKNIRVLFCDVLKEKS